MVLGILHSENEEEAEAHRRKVEEALECDYSYPEAAEEDVKRWERSAAKLPPHHKALLSHLPLKFQKLRCKGGTPPCRMSNLRRCERKFGSLLGSRRRNEKRRIVEERRRTILGSDVQELSAQVNTLIKLPRSPPPSSVVDGEEDEDDEEDEMVY
ncbi:hypothetical protein CQW23_18729 [Capsicum baccatum]|uniref:Uncharacterized protein n=1 Tax=Capsicum baccatum TaxID=33114 RepID=A0A2G2W3S1_CAPBA|nr:hypothetical protein CQW23_18729 [Capsicum baccatum]